MYQTIWQRYLSFAVGSDAGASVLILTVFLTALSLGYWLAGRWSSRLGQKELFWYGAVECLIGLWAVLFPWLFALGMEQLLVPGLPTWVIDGLLTVLLTAPPAVLMGVTLPFLTQGLSVGFDSASLTHARVYGVNTMGAFLGVVLAGFYLLENWGLAISSWVLGVLNVLLGLLVMWISHKPGAVRSPVPTVLEPAVEAAPASPPQPSVNRFQILVVAGCSGFLLIALETYFIRLFSVITEGSHHAYPAVVGAFIASVGLGAFLAGRWLSRAQQLFAWVPVITFVSWVLIYGSLPAWPFVDAQLKWWILALPIDPMWLMVVRCLLLLLIIAIPVVASSMLLPWAFHFFKQRQTALGQTTGQLYAVATLATVVGGLMGGFALFKWLNYWQIFFVFLVLMLFMAMAAFRAMGRPRKQQQALWFAAIPALLLVFWQAPRTLEDRLALGFYFHSNAKELGELNDAQTAHEQLWRWFGHDHIIAAGMQPEGRVDVFESEVTEQRMIAINGRSNSDTAPADLTGNGLLGLFPYLLTENPEQVLIIGLGTGVTAGVLAQQTRVQQVNVCEINAAVIDQLPLFDRFTDHVSVNQKLQVIHSDVIKHLHQTNQSYDLIVSIPSNFWVAGVDHLLTPEFYDLVKNRLNPGGSFVQWVPEYRFSGQGLQMVARAFVERFDNSSLWQLTPHDLVFIHHQSQAVPWQQPWLSDRGQDQTFRATLRELGVYNVRQLLTARLADHAGVRQLGHGAALHSLDRPQLGLAALWALYANDTDHNSSQYIERILDTKKAPR